MSGIQTPMPRSLLNVKEVAASLHVSTREVIRMAEQGILPATRMRGEWQFRSGELWNWIEENVHSLAERRRKDRDPVSHGDLLVAPALRETAIDVNLNAKTKSSLLREIAKLAEFADPYVSATDLAETLGEREASGSTALQDGVAIPHPATPIFAQGPVLAAARTMQGIPFGERGGGMTDLFFLICCTDQKEHLIYLGRLCRLLIDRDLQTKLREAETAAEFLRAIERAEQTLCKDSIRA